MTWRLAALLNRIRKANTMTSPTPAAPVKGCDYSTSKPSISALKPAGIHFAVRYTSPGANPKNLTKAELTALLAAGLDVAVVFESFEGRMLGGHPAGVSDADEADNAVKALGMPGLPVYFACDFDVQPAQLAACDAYLDGAASVIGGARLGVYGGLRIVKHELDRGVTYAWQTYAWSGGVWDDRAQLRQVKNGVPLAGGTVDLDEAHAADFGQWPRPKATPPPIRSGKYVADGTKSMRELAHLMLTSVPAIWFATVLGKDAEGQAGFGALERDYLYAGDWDAKMTKGTLIWLP